MKKNNSPVSDRAIYSWNLLGNLCASGVSVGYLMVVTRLAAASVADSFSLATSIASLWIVIGFFQVRNFQGTDVAGRFSFEGYFQTRLVTVAVMWLTLLPYLFFIGGGQVDGSLLLSTSLFLLYRTVDAFSDVLQGYFQQIGRLDRAGQAMTFRNVGSLLVFAGGLLTFSSLFLALCLLLGWNLLFFFWYELSSFTRYYPLSLQGIFFSWDWQAVGAIIRSCSTLFVNGFLLLYVLNEPKLAIEKGLQLGHLPAGSQRDFAILFMPVFFMSMCILVIRPFITEMAILWERKAYKTFSRSLRKLIGLLILSGLLVTLVAYLLGIPVLSFVFQLDLSAYVTELTLLVFSGGLYALAIAFEQVLTIYRKHAYLSVTYVLIALLAHWFTKRAVFHYGLLGACLSFAAVMVVYLLGTLVTYRLVHLLERKKDD